MRIESTSTLHVAAAELPEVAAAKKKTPIVVNPELVAQFNTVIRPKDKKNSLTEGELYAGVMYNRVLKHGGAQVAAQYLEVFNIARKAGKSLMHAAYAAWLQVDTFIERALFPGDKKAAQKADKIASQIKREAIEGCQIDHNGSVSDPKNTKTSYGKLVSRTWQKAYKMAEDNLKFIDARSAS